eukprot:TRINITY_DN57074_c0_g1_i1.p2 TRINITY_DN57074_c0_g1~~TRINITY_DN57074_c0_g1_i1.p2  ORF type:complete len:392 (-),score=90.81 TRINITY_DN57074_c0_g1_i1:149-1324(-)
MPAGPGGGALERFRRGTDLLNPDVFEATGGGEAPPIGDTGEFLTWLIRCLSLPSVLLLIGLGAWVRSRGIVPRENADGLRRLTFNYLLPAFLLRHIWQAALDAELYSIAAWSFVFHGVWFAASFVAGKSLQPHNLSLRGWSMLMTQGTMNSFLYPLLMKHDRFGQRALAGAVLWDLGGNMWICQLALFAIAAYFAPGRQEKESLELFEQGGARTKVTMRSMEAAMRGVGSELEQCMPRSVLADAMRQPVLIACVLGFLLNCVAMPLPAAVDMLLCVVGEPYRVALYFIVGYYSDTSFEPGDLQLLGRTVAARYTIAAVLILVAFTALPLDLVYRQTIALVVLSPSSSYLIHLVAEHSYGETLLRLTVCGTFLTTIFSTFAQHTLIGIFESL